MSDPIAGPRMEDSLPPLTATQQQSARDQNMVTYIGLFLLLLVFFILLSTIAQQRHDRAFATADSLAATFGQGRVVGHDGPGSDVPRSAQLLVTERVGRFVESWSARLRIEVRHSGERIQFALPVSAAFARPDGAALQTEAGEFLADLAAQMREASADAPIALDVIVGSTIIGSWSPDMPPPLPLARAALIARVLSEQGLGRAMLTVGVEVVDAPRLRFIVRPRDGEAPDARP